MTTAPATEPMTDQRLAEIRELVVECSNWSLGMLASRDLLAEVDRLRNELVEARSKALEEAAEEVVAYCPEHGRLNTCRLSCECHIAGELRQMASKPTAAP